jgi:hypothetical protein
MPRSVRLRTFDGQRYRAWQAMRVLLRFTRAQLQVTSGIGWSNCICYLRALRRAGYVRVTQQQRRGQPGGYVAYHLIRNTGPLPPIIWDQGLVYDQNTGQAFDQGTGEICVDVVITYEAPTRRRSICGMAAATLSRKS